MYLVYSLRAKIIYKPKLTLFTNNDIITRTAECACLCVREKGEERRLYREEIEQPKWVEEWRPTRTNSLKNGAR